MKNNKERIKIHDTIGNIDKTVSMASAVSESIGIVNLERRLLHLLKNWNEKKQSIENLRKQNMPSTIQVNDFKRVAATYTRGKPQSSNGLKFNPSK
jgi:hypothetical protein